MVEGLNWKRLQSCARSRCIVAVVDLCVVRGCCEARAEGCKDLDELSGVSVILSPFPPSNQPQSVHQNREILAPSQRDTYLVQRRLLNLPENARAHAYGRGVSHRVCSSARRGASLLRWRRPARISRRGICRRPLKLVLTEKFEKLKMAVGSISRGTVSCSAWCSTNASCVIPSWSTARCSAGRSSDGSAGEC